MRLRPSLGGFCCEPVEPRGQHRSADVCKFLPWMGMPGAPPSTGGGGYQISRSLRFRANNSAVLSRTPAGAGTSTTKATISFWIKPTSGFLTATRSTLISTGSPGVANAFLLVMADASYSGQMFVRTDATNDVRFPPLSRDFSAHKHVCVYIDTTQATAANRIRIDINGVNVASSAGSMPSQNSAINLNTTNAQYLCQDIGNSGYYTDCLLSDFYIIDGQALDSSNFGAITATTGAWDPKAYTGSFGTNGTYLPFSNNSTTTTVCADASGNGNNWTGSGISVTAGVTNDSLVDTPTNYGTDTGAGGEVRGNYCTLNPLDKGAGITLASGNLDASGSTTTSVARGTFALQPTDKLYWEVVVNSIGSDAELGIATALASLASYPDGQASCWVWYSADGKIYNNAVNGGANSTYTTGDVLGFSWDGPNSTLKFYKNGTLQTYFYTGLSAGPYFPICATRGSVSMNCGQRPFAFAAPTGFKALCTQNLADPTTKNARSLFDVNLRAGTGAAGSVSGKALQPDLAWSKSRSSRAHVLSDSTHGVGKYLSTNSNGAETTDAQAVTAFNSGGFSFGTSAANNTNGESFVDWLFKKAAGFFDIVQYTGTGSAMTVAHSLGVVPAFYVTKAVGATGSWHAYHKKTGASNTLYMDFTLASTATSDWNGTAPTSSVISVGTPAEVNTAGQVNEVLLFAEQAGLCRIDSYTGNGASDGTPVYCGFRPRWIMIKRTDTGNDWVIIDTARQTYNIQGTDLWANLLSAEGTDAYLDITSTGFKLRSTGAAVNASGGTYAYIAIADVAAKFARAA